MVDNTTAVVAPRPKLGRYELIERLGRGGMAEVYKATLPGVHGVDKPVAIKRILPHALLDPRFVKLFVREARLTARLMHPNLIQVFEFGQEGNELFLAMELVDGCDLRRVLHAQANLGKPLPPELAVCIAHGMLQGLEHAHRLKDESGQPLNVVHRDLSPTNVLLSYAGAIKVADFGVAHVDSPERSDADLLKGKLPYMAPEQLAGKEVDARVDVFAAACVIYEMLAGEPVYGGHVTPQLVRRISRGEVPQLRQVLPQLEVGLAEAVQRALDPDPDRRTPSCERFDAELLELVHAGRVRSVRESELALYLQILVPREAGALEPPAAVPEPPPEPIPDVPTSLGRAPPRPHLELVPEPREVVVEGEPLLSDPPEADPLASLFDDLPSDPVALHTSDLDLLRSLAPQPPILVEVRPSAVREMRPLRRVRRSLLLALVAAEALFAWHWPALRPPPKLALAEPRGVATSPPRRESRSSSALPKLNLELPPLQFEPQVMSAKLLPPPPPVTQPDATTARRKPIKPALVEKHRHRAPASGWE